MLRIFLAVAHFVILIDGSFLEFISHSLPRTNVPNFTGDFDAALLPHCGAATVIIDHMRLGVFDAICAVHTVFGAISVFHPVFTPTRLVIVFRWIDQCVMAIVEMNVNIYACIISSDLQKRASICLANTKIIFFTWIASSGLFLSRLLN